MLKIKKFLPIALAALVLGFMTPLSVTSLVSAQEPEQRVIIDEKKDEHRKMAEQNAQKSLEERKTEAKQRLDEHRLKMCQNRERVINNIMGRMSDRGSKQLDVFNKIFERTQAFYESKGRTATNYAALVADANVKKAAAEAAVAKTKTTSVEFKCDGNDPKGAAAAFQGNLKEQNAALKAYKTSIHNLIVAVKSAQSSMGGQQ